MFPSFCLEEGGRERVEGRRVDFDGAENSLVDFEGTENSLVDFDGVENSPVDFEGEEKSRACSVAGLGSGGARFCFDFFEDPKFFLLSGKLLDLTELGWLPFSPTILPWLAFDTTFGKPLSCGSWMLIAFDTSPIAFPFLGCFVSFGFLSAPVLNF